MHKRAILKVVMYNKRGWGHREDMSENQNILKHTMPSEYFTHHMMISVMISIFPTESWHSWFPWSLILLYLLSSDGICLTRHCATLTYQNYFNSTTRYRQALVLHVYSNGNIMKAWNRESHSHSLNAKGISELDVLYSLWNMNMNIRS